MSLERYFDKFPVITYANNQAIDITKRVTLLDRVSSNPYVFYPYEISSNERADQLSYRYYKDPYRSWILYLTNKIVDPYYEWYMSNDEFNNFIIKKYGSTVVAQQKIKHYRSNWANSIETTITPSEWNALTTSQQEYWEPVFATNGSIRYYERKQKDWTHVTNKIVSYTITATDFQLQSFATDEIVTIHFNSTYSGNGQVIKVDSNTNTLYLKLNNSGYDGKTSSFSQGETLTIRSKVNSLFSVSVNNGGLGFSNNDMVVFTSAIRVRNPDGLKRTDLTYTDSWKNNFSINDIITQPDTGSQAKIFEILPNYFAGDKDWDDIIFRIKPLNTDLLNTSLASEPWKFSNSYTDTYSVTHNNITNGGSGAARPRIPSLLLRLPSLMTSRAGPS